jgi:hypothetical protein
MRCARCHKIVYRYQVLEIGVRAYCPFCRARICRLCACVEENACEGGCAWREDDTRFCTNHTDGEIARAA